MSWLAEHEDLIRIIALNVMLACSLSLPLRMGQFQVSQPAFMAVGAYAGALISLHLDWPFPLVIVAAVAMATAAAVVVGAVLLNRLTAVFLALSSFVVVELLRVAVFNVGSLGGALGLYNVPRRATTALIVGMTVAVVVLLFLLDRSRFGVAMRTVRDDRLAAAGIGLSVRRMDLIVFALSAAIAGLAGVLRAHFIYTVNPNDFGLGRILDLLTFTIVGGIAVVAGPVVGAISVTLLNEGLSVFREWRTVVNGGLLLAIVLFLPGGLASIPSVLRRGTGWVRSSVAGRRAVPAGAGQGGGGP